MKYFFIFAGLVLLAFSSGVYLGARATGPLIAQGHLAPYRARPAAYCPCAELLQPVHITARRWHAAPARMKIEMDCSAPVGWLESHKPRPVEWSEPPLREFTVAAVSTPAVRDPTSPLAHVWNQTLPGGYEWSGPPEYFPPAGADPRRQPPKSVPEPSTWLLMAAGAGAALLLRRRQVA